MTYSEKPIKFLKKRSHRFSVYVSQDFSRCPPKNKYFKIVVHTQDHSTYIVRFSSVRPTAIQYFQYLTNDRTFFYLTERYVFPQFILSHVSWKELVDYFQTEALFETL